MNRKILNIAIPNIISNITIPLLGLVDLALMGHLQNEAFIGAIALGGMIFNFLYWGFGFLRMGTSGITAQAYGARNFKESVLTLTRAMMVAIGAGLLLIIFQKPIEWTSFFLLEGDKEIEELAMGYFRIRIWAAPATIGLYAITGWFIGMQNAKIPMLMAIVSNILNIILSYLFVYPLHMDAQGVALGTVVAQYCAFFMGIILLYRYYRKLIKFWTPEKLFDLTSIKNFFLVNRDIFLRTLCIIFVFTFFTSQSASTSNTILAVNSLLLQFLFIFSYLMDGFAYAAESLVGRYVGAQNIKLLNKTIRLLFYWGAGISILFSTTYYMAGEQILSLLTNNIEIIESAQPYMKWVILMPILGFASFIYDGVYIGATASAYMRKTMMAATILVFIPVYIVLSPYINNHGLWLAMLSFLFSRGFFQAIYYRKAILRLFTPQPIS